MKDLNQTLNLSLNAGFEQPLSKENSTGEKL